MIGVNSSQLKDIIVNFAQKAFVRNVQLKKHMKATFTPLVKIQDVKISTNEGFGPPKDCVRARCLWDLFWGAALGAYSVGS